MFSLLSISIYSNGDRDINEKHGKQKYLGVDQVMYSSVFSADSEKPDETSYKMEGEEVVDGDNEVFEFPPLQRLTPGAVGEKVHVELESGLWFTRITRAIQPPVFGNVLVFFYMIMCKNHNNCIPLFNWCYKFNI